MRTRDNRVIRFILEFSQVLLVFFGVYSALMCTATSLELTYDHVLIVAIMFISAIVFYGLFTVLETFRKGKLYGLLGITLFFVLISFRFLGAMEKGLITAVNGFLKEFMNYTGTTLSLFTYTDTDGSSVKFCTNLLLILIGVYLIAIVSAFFYRRRRSKVFVLATLPFVILPLVVGKIGHYVDFFTYLIVAMTIIGTRHLRTDAIDRRMRQKLAIILMLVGLVCGGISYVFIPPQRYYGSMDKLTQAKNSIMALSSWSADDVFTWLKAYFNDDAITYGKLGRKKELSYNGQTMLKISGSINVDHGMYLKGYVGDRYEDNRWSSLSSNDEYKKDLDALDNTGVTLDNWHAQLRNELGDNERSGVKDVWQTGKLRIRNLAFGYGNYLVPYLPTNTFQYAKNGRVVVEQPGIDYDVEYYCQYPYVLKQDILQNNYRMANGPFWESNKAERDKLRQFADKYYRQIPENLTALCNEFKDELEKQNHFLSRYQAGNISQGEMIKTVRSYIAKNTSYTLAPGKTPVGKDTVEYFLKENKKGYCTYYATTAAILLRSVGIPTRYVEGMYVSKEELESGVEDKGEIEVPDEDAHAWIEVYDEKYGFVPVEVTPGQGEEDTIESTEPQPSDNPDDNSQNEEGRQQEEDPEMGEATPTPAVTETPEESMVFDDIDGNEDSSDDGASDKGSKQGSHVWWYILEAVLIILLVLSCVEGQRRIRSHVFLRNMRSMRARRRIRMAHHHLMPVFAARSVVYRGQSMAEYTAQIAKAMELPEEEITVFVELIYHARFGPDDISEEELRSFAEIYHHIRNKAYEDVTFIKKLYYMYIMVL